MESDEGLQATDAGAANENGWRTIPRVVAIVRGGAGRESSDLVVVQFDDGWVDPDGYQELLHDVAHAARVSAEDYHRMLRYETPDSRLGRFRHVDG